MENNQCTEALRETAFRLSHVGYCEKSLSVTAIKTYPGSTQGLARRIFYCTEHYVTVNTNSLLYLFLLSALKE